MINVHMQITLCGYMSVYNSQSILPQTRIYGEQAKHLTVLDVCPWIASKTFYCFGRVPATSRQNILLFRTRVYGKEAKHFIVPDTCLWRAGKNSMVLRQNILLFGTRACVEQVKHFIVLDACLPIASKAFYCSARVSMESR